MDNTLAVTSPGRMLAWARWQAQTSGTGAVGPEELAEQMLRYCLQVEAIIRATAKAWPCEHEVDHDLYVDYKQAVEGGGIPDIILRCNGQGCKGILIEVKIDAGLTAKQDSGYDGSGQHRILVVPAYSMHSGTRLGEAATGSQDTDARDAGKWKQMSWRQFAETIAQHLPVDLDGRDPNCDLLRTMADYGEAATIAMPPLTGDCQALADDDVLDALSKLRVPPTAVDDLAKSLVNQRFSSCSPSAAKYLFVPTIDKRGSASKRGSAKSWRLEIDPSYTGGDDLAWPYWLQYDAKYWFLAPHRRAEEGHEAKRLPCPALADVAQRITDRAKSLVAACAELDKHAKPVSKRLVDDLQSCQGSLAKAEKAAKTINRRMKEKGLNEPDVIDLSGSIQPAEDPSAEGASDTVGAVTDWLGWHLSRWGCRASTSQVDGEEADDDLMEHQETIHLASEDLKGLVNKLEEIKEGVLTLTEKLPNLNEGGHCCERADDAIHEENCYWAETAAKVVPGYEHAGALIWTAFYYFRVTVARKWTTEATKVKATLTSGNASDPWELTYVINRHDPCESTIMSAKAESSAMMVTIGETKLGFVDVDDNPKTAEDLMTDVVILTEKSLAAASQDQDGM